MSSATNTLFREGNSSPQTPLDKLLQEKTNLWAWLQISQNNLDLDRQIQIEKDLDELTKKIDFLSRSNQPK